MPRSSLQSTYSEGKRRNCSLGRRTHFLPSRKDTPPRATTTTRNDGEAFDDPQSSIVGNCPPWPYMDRQMRTQKRYEEPETRSQNESQHLDWNLNSSAQNISFSTFSETDENIRMCWFCLVEYVTCRLCTSFEIGRRGWFYASENS
jgi:hypothetical protein